MLTDAQISDTSTKTGMSTTLTDAGGPLLKEHLWNKDTLVNQDTWLSPNFLTNQDEYFGPKSVRIRVVYSVIQHLDATKWLNT